LILDSSLNSTSSVWSLDKSKVWFLTQIEYTGSYLESFDTYDEVLTWMYDTGSLEQQYWDSNYENPDDDPYGIDGPFPEEMDETIV
jgi:hypothetical protein